MNGVIRNAKSWKPFFFSNYNKTTVCAGGIKGMNPRFFLPRRASRELGARDNGPTSQFDRESHSLRRRKRTRARVNSRIVLLYARIIADKFFLFFSAGKKKEALFDV